MAILPTDNTSILRVYLTFSGYTNHTYGVIGYLDKLNSYKPEFCPKKKKKYGTL